VSTSTAGDDGFAPAAGPVADTVVRTPSDGLHTERLGIDVDGHLMTAFVARPAEADAGIPVVVVVSEAFGLHAHIEDIARRFARLGYLAIVPDLMGRYGDPSSYDDVDLLVTDLLQRIPDTQVLRDLDATIDWATAHGGDADRVGATGYCWGGRWVWLLAAHRPLAAAVAWYGILDGRASGAYPDETLFPQHPVDIADELQTPILGLYGGRDDAIPVETIEAMRSSLARRPSAVPPAEITVFDDAGHAFFADYRDTFVPDAAAQAWADAISWFRRHGV
jgi:carboxymethylenebutenolidase